MESEPGVKIDLKKCNLVEILKVEGGAKLLIKKLPNESEVGCTFEKCKSLKAEYVTLALSDEDFIGFACHPHLEVLRNLVAAKYSLGTFTLPATKTRSSNVR